MPRSLGKTTHMPREGETRWYPAGALVGPDHLVHPAPTYMWFVDAGHYTWARAKNGDWYATGPHKERT